jgi:hypothetical protein
MSTVINEMQEFLTEVTSLNKKATKLGLTVVVKKEGGVKSPAPRKRTTTRKPAAKTKTATPKRTKKATKAKTSSTRTSKKTTSKTTKKAAPKKTTKKSSDALAF